MRVGKLVSKFKSSRSRRWARDAIKRLEVVLHCAEEFALHADILRQRDGLLSLEVLEDHVRLCQQKSFSE